MKLLGFSTAVILALLCQDQDLVLVQAKLGGSIAASSNTEYTYDNEVFPRLHMHIRDDKRKLTELESHGGNPDDDFIPLGECEGDCDDDKDVSIDCLALPCLALTNERSYYFISSSV